jgi:hypothetical protein
MINVTGVFNSVLGGLTTNIFGTMALTTSFIIIFFVLFALLIRIPVPFAFALGIPMSVVFASFGYMPVMFAGLLSAAFLVLSMTSLLIGLGNR